MPTICKHYAAAIIISLAAASSYAQQPAAVDVPPSGQMTADIPAGHYVLDKTHSTLIFKVSHLGFSFYTAAFSSFDATLELDPANLENAKLAATIDLSSLTLPAPPEGFLNELLGPKWLNATAFPQMTYRSRWHSQQVTTLPASLAIGSMGSEWLISSALVIKAHQRH